MAAAACGNSDLIRLLIDWGADLHKVNAASCSALTQAIAHNQHAAVNLLMDAGMDVNAPGYPENENFV